MGDDIEIEIQVLICSNCGNELYDEELDSQTLLKVYNEYRKNINYYYLMK